MLTAQFQQPEPRKQLEMRKSTTLAIFILCGMTSGCATDFGDEPEVGVGVTEQAVVGEGHPWTHGDLSWRVAYEARYALSQSANGTSSMPRPGGGYYGDWNYVGSDSFAHGRASAEAGGGSWVGSTGYYNGYYAGGECTYFVRLVLYRSTYWSFSDHYTTPNYGVSSMYNINAEMDSNPSNWQPGWALRGNGHYAIADQRASGGWWMIDSNWVGGSDSQRIGKHFFSDSQLASGGYYGWKPVRGSNNW